MIYIYFWMYKFFTLSFSQSPDCLPKAVRVKSHHIDWCHFMSCSMLYLYDVICSWNIIMVKHSMFIKSSKVKIINEGMLSRKDFLCHLKNKTDKGFKRWCPFMSGGLSGQGTRETGVPTTDDWLTDRTWRDSLIYFDWWGKKALLGMTDMCVMPWFSHTRIDLLYGTTMDPVV